MIGGRQILVLGNGYLGSYLVGQLRHDGGNVVVASKNGTGDCLEADLGGIASIEKLGDDLRSLDFIPSAIVHCASSSRGGPDAYRAVFVEGISNLVRVFPKSQIVLTSSTSVYPQVDGETVTEESPANPDRLTGRYLREAEEKLIAANGVALRLAGIYGPDRSVHLKKMLDGSATIESGEVSRYLNQIHRDDAASAISHVIKSDPDLVGGNIFNVADDESISQRYCYEKLAEILGKPIPGEFPPDKNRKRAWTHKKVCNKKLKATGWNPQFPSFVDAVKDDARLLSSIEVQTSNN